MLDAADIAGAADVCVIDSNVAELFYKRDNVVGKSLDAMIGGSYVRLEIVGIASSGGNILQNMVGDVIPSFAYLPYTTVQRYTGEDSFGQIARHPAGLGGHRCGGRAAQRVGQPVPQHRARL